MMQLWHVIYQKEELSTLTIPNTFLTPGEICCAKSHLEGGKTIVRKQSRIHFYF